MSVCARLFKQLQTKIWFDDLPRVQKIVLFSTSSSSVHEKSVALVHAFTLSKSAMKNYTRAKTNMIWEKQNLMTMKMMRWGEKKKSDSYIVLLLAVCVLVVCLFRVFRCVSQLSCYRFAQGYIVNWMETSIIVSRSMCVCVNMCVCVSFFSLF